MNTIHKFTALDNPPRQFLCYNLMQRLGNRMFIFASNYGIAKEKNMILPTHKADFRCFKMQIKDNIIQYHNNKQEICRNAKRYNTKFACKYTPEDKIFGNESCVLLQGYLQSWKYFKDSAREIRQLFTFQPDIIEKAERFLQETKKEHFMHKKTLKKVTFVGIHVRRGDMVNSSKGYMVASRSYFLKAMAVFKKKFRHIIFVVASDTRKWCEENLPDTIYMTKKGSSGVLDMAILSRCNHTISSVGTFSWWSAWLTNGITTYYMPPAREGSRLRKVFSQDYLDFFWPGWIPIRDEDRTSDIHI